MSDSIVIKKNTNTVGSLTVTVNKNGETTDLIFMDLELKKARKLRSNTELVNLLLKKDMDIGNINEVLEFLNYRLTELMKRDIRERIEIRCGEC